MNQETPALPAEALCWRCDEAALGFRTTAELDGAFQLIGQGRAAEAIELGLSVRASGYNVYVAGVSGSGRLTGVRRLLEHIDLEPPALTDKCYVHNFAEPDRPVLLRLPVGQGCALRRDMDLLVRNLREHLGEVFEGEEYQARRKALAQRGSERAAALFHDLEAEMRQDGFQIVRLQMGPYVRPDVVPVVDGEPMIFEQLEEQVRKGERKDVDIEALRGPHDAYHERLDTIVKQANVIERDTTEQLMQLEQEYAKWAVGPMIATLMERYDDPEARAYLEAIEHSILEDLERFRKDKPDRPEGMPFAMEDEFIEYQVNVLVDNGKTTGAPIIVETAPTYPNLFGSMEAAVGRFGRMSTNHTKIHAGSLVRADGGYIVFDLVDAITEFGVWKALKRTLLSGQLDIRNEAMMGGVSVFGIKPQPIPLDVKICVIGSRDLYHLLYAWDDDFHRVFKIKADFDYEMGNSAERVRDMARFIARITEEEGLLAWDASAVAALMEEAARLTGRQRKLTARFGRLADLIRQADHYARSAGAELVARAHVATTVAKKIARTNLLEEKIREAIDEGSLLIDTQGAVVGQVNGLAVYSLGDYQFGKPARITAKTGVGQSGIVNIEREAKLSGASHDKGVLILQGYFRGTYAQDRPIALSASLCFEQSYSGVDGDSASTTELYALCSSLSGLPVAQGIGVTGSMNQHGRVQAIGGVNEKIEGFFELCEARGLTGEQGVIIPRSNAGDLMLRDDVIAAVDAGRFHVWAIEHVDEGLELLLGLPAGERDADGHYPEDTVHGRIEAALVEMGEILKRYDHGGAEDEGEGEPGHTDDEDDGEAGPEEPEDVDPTRDDQPGGAPPAPEGSEEPEDDTDPD